MDVPAVENKRIVLKLNDGASLEIPIKSALQCDKLRKLATTVVSCNLLCVRVDTSRQLMEKVLVYLEKHAAGGDDGGDGGIEEFDAAFIRDFSVPDLFDLVGVASDLEAMMLGVLGLKQILEHFDLKTAVDFLEKFGISENDVKKAIEMVTRAINSA